MIITKDQIDTTTKDVVGLIIAGGAAKRLGMPKHRAELGGVSLLSHAAKRFAHQVSSLAVNLRTEDDSCGYPVLVDNLRGEGPLSAVLLGLEWAADQGAGYLLTMPIDVPFFPSDFCQTMQRGCGAYKGGFAVAAGRVHGLCALWPVSALPLFRKAFCDEGVRTVNKMHDILDSCAVVFPHKGGHLFMNINTPEDLLAANTVLNKAK